MKTLINLQVNGEIFEVAVEPNTTLLEVLRGTLGLTGAKEACGVGECGACTVILDGKAVYSCLLLAMDTIGKNVITIEGLSKKGQLDPVQEAFVKHGAFQCGFCTPGMILSAKALLEQNPNPSEHQVRMSLAGNLCRCTGYSKIVAAILASSKDQ
jgi:carbon-monoxide dehydrogenase small subunit